MSIKAHKSFNGLPVWSFRVSRGRNLINDENIHRKSVYRSSDCSGSVWWINMSVANMRKPKNSLNVS